MVLCDSLSAAGRSFLRAVEEAVVIESHPGLWSGRRIKLEQPEL